MNVSLSVVETLFLMLIVPSLAFAVKVPTVAEGRCVTWKDNLEQNEAAGRVDFALGCEQDHELIRTIKLNLKGITRLDGPVTPGYPTYGVYNPEAANDDDVYTHPGDWRAPLKKSPCEVIPKGYKIVFFCASGCYSPEQSLLFPGGAQSIVEAMGKGYKSVMTLSSSSTIEEPKMKESRISQFITDVVPGRQELLNFEMASGGKLRVTKNHPLVDSSGSVRQAATLKTGDFLVKSGGELDLISNITEEVVFGKVYNVGVDSADPREQIVVAQGYLNGALYYQNQGVKDLNRQLLRTSVASELVSN